MYLPASSGEGGWGPGAVRAVRARSACAACPMLRCRCNVSAALRRGTHDFAANIGGLLLCHYGLLWSVPCATLSVQDRAALGRPGHLEGEDDDLAVLGALEARLAVGLQAGEGRERHLSLAGVLRRGGGGRQSPSGEEAGPACVRLSISSQSIFFHGQ